LRGIRLCGRSLGGIRLGSVRLLLGRALRFDLSLRRGHRRLLARVERSARSRSHRRRRRIHLAASGRRRHPSSASARA
jgi:hypothetical protein